MRKQLYQILNTEQRNECLNTFKNKLKTDKTTLKYKKFLKKHPNKILVTK